MPGQSRLHYSPGIPLQINMKKPQTDGAFLLIRKKKNYIP